jgi:aminopeptidase N
VPVASTPPVPRAPEDCAGESSVDVRHHAVDLAVRLDPPVLTGTGALRVRARRTTARIALDARDLAVTEVRSGGATLRFVRDAKRLCIDLTTPLQAGAEATLDLVWSVATKGDTPHVAGDQVWAGYNTSAWMPTLQDPAQRATLALRITAPATMQVAASGRRLGRTEGSAGLTAHAFALDRPSPPFLYAFAAGRFDEAELATASGTKLRALGPPGADLKAALAITAPMLAFLEQHTGAPFPAEEYLQIFVKGDAAQEAAGLSLIGEDALEDVRKEPTEDWVFAHELAHQWFAWLVPCADFADFWLNEGFATFLVAAIKEQRWGRAAYDREVALWHERSAKVHAQGKDAPLSLSDPHGVIRKPPRESELQPRGVTYSRGALVLHKLRAELGDAVFWNAVREYVRRSAGRGARSEELRAALEASSGRDLRTFFARWVYAAAPDL